MKPLFKTKIKYTIEEYKKYCNAFYRKLYVFLLIFSITYIILGIVNKNLFYLFIVLFCFLMKFFSKNVQIKAFTSNKLTFNKEAHYEFYEDYFIAKTEFSDSKIEYSSLYKVIETKDNIYMMIGSRQGYLFSKKNFPKGLEEFLKKKTVNIKR